MDLFVLLRSSLPLGELRAFFARFALIVSFEEGKKVLIKLVPAEGESST